MNRNSFNKAYEKGLREGIKRSIGAITATVEPMPNYPAYYGIMFRICGVLLGRSTITFNNRNNAERFLTEMLTREFND
jgi:hypothetical protein